MHIYSGASRLRATGKSSTYADVCRHSVGIYMVERVACARLQRALPPSRPYTTTCVSSYCILLCTATYYNICVLTLNISVYYLHSATYIVEQVACARLERALRMLTYATGKRPTYAHVCRRQHTYMCPHTVYYFVLLHTTACATGKSSTCADVCRRMRRMMTYTDVC